jgi:acetyl-CoA carboxylase biotin carboxylase subunit
MFNKILIANRGEIAVRIMNACRELNIQTVAIFSEADANALHVRRADEAILIGEAPSADSYLRADRIIDAARSTGCEAIHPGYGFLAENAAFADAVRDAGLTFIGPPADAIARMGSKTEARQLMIEAGVPVVPGFALDAEDIDFPVLVKAAAGGGGKGMRVVIHADDLPSAIETAQREAKSAFGDDTVFLEKYLPSAHHIEYQILADSFGATVHLFERECSIQRRHQKIIEETPSPLLNDDLRAEMGAAAVAAAQAVGYENAGTVEFIVDDAGHFYFLEMNTRLQVEHPITEMVTGLDLVHLQIHIADGQPLPFSQNDLRQRGHAIECRIYAENPAHGFLPDVGPLLLVETPMMPGVRVDSGVETGDDITTYYDPMIAKLIVFGGDRPQAIHRMRAALEQYTILGVATNIAFLRDVIAHEAFFAGQTTTAFIDNHLAEWTPQPPTESELDIAAIAASLLSPKTGNVTAHDPWNRTDSFRMGRR